MSSDAWQPRREKGRPSALAPRIARIVAAGGKIAAAPIEWRQVGLLAPGRAGGQTDPHFGAKPDSSAELAHLQQQCEARVKEAHLTGLRDGEASAKARAAAEVQAVLQQLARSILDLAQMRALLRKQAEGDTIKLSLAIATRVLRREITVDPDAMRGLVIASLEKLQARDTCRVRVNPSQAAAITAILRQAATNDKIEVVPDGALAPGGIVFETNHGNLEASIDSQLQEIERGLADQLRKQS